VDVGASTPLEVEVGVTVALTISASCPFGCDLHGGVVRILAPDGAVMGQSALKNRDGSASSTAQITIEAPTTVGVFEWSVELLPPPEGDPSHLESAARLALDVAPHAISLAAWDLPLPLVRGHPSKIKVGARCSVGCVLTGKEVEIQNECGATVARGLVGDRPWPETSALYWTELDVTSPAIDGAHSWTLKLATDDWELPHQGASSPVGVMVVGPPEHLVTVQVRDRETQAPVKHAEVRLGVYRGGTGGDGLVKLALPGGAYDLNARKVGYEAFSQVVDVARDLTVQIDLAVAPVQSEEYWM